MTPLERTMLITLWARARETQRSDAIVRDRHAVRIAGAIDYDLSRFEGGWKTQVGVAVRTRVFDAAARAFVARNPDGTIINLGAGLDARFHRIDNGRIRWFDVDTPSAIAVRRRYLSEGPRNRCLADCALETGWIDAILTTHAHSAPRVLVLGEGVLMFIEETRVRALLDRLAGTFPGGEMLFDLIGGLMVRFPLLHDTLPALDERFRWGLGDPDELRSWSARYEVIDLVSMLAESPTRWRWMRWLRFIPPMRRQFMVARLRFGATPDGAAASRSRPGH